MEVSRLRRSSLAGALPSHGPLRPSRRRAARRPRERLADGRQQPVQRERLGDHAHVRRPRGVTQSIGPTRSSHSRSASAPVAGSDVAARLLDDAVHRREAQSGTLPRRLGREERLEGPLPRRLIHPYARVLHGKRHVRAGREPGQRSAAGASSSSTSPTASRRVPPGGFRSLRESAVQWVRQGETTLQEVERVLGDAGDGEPSLEAQDPQIPLSCPGEGSASASGGLSGGSRHHFQAQLGRRGPGARRDRSPARRRSYLETHVATLPLLAPPRGRSPPRRGRGAPRGRRAAPPNGHAP